MIPNKNRHKLIVTLTVVATVFLLLLLNKGLGLDGKKMTSPLVGQPAQNFHLSLLQGSRLLLGHEAESLDLSELKGSPLILNFWASWCSTCAEESHILEAFWKDHAQEGIKVLGIAVHDKKEEVLTFVQSAGKTFAIGLDEEGRVSLNFGVTGVPETVFINAQGVVIHKETGPLNRRLLENMWIKLKESAT